MGNSNTYRQVYSNYYFIFCNLIFIDRIWLAFLNLPKATLRRFEANNNKKVEQKLVKAFLLASHGELETAAKEAALVSRNTKDKNLGKLLNTHINVFNKINKNSNENEELSKIILNS